MTVAAAGGATSSGGTKGNAPRAPQYASKIGISVASGKRDQCSCSELDQELKLPFDLVIWGFQLCAKSAEHCPPRRRQFLGWPIPLSKATSNPFDKEQP